MINHAPSITVANEWIIWHPTNKLKCSVTGKYQMGEPESAHFSPGYREDALAESHINALDLLGHDDQPDNLE
jgi:hypothetical protein